MKDSVDNPLSRLVRHAKKFRSMPSQFLMLHLECADEQR